MMVKHHLPDEYLMAYSAGILSESFSLVVAAHVSLSDDSRARMEAYDAVGGAVLDSAPVANLSDGSLQATLDRIMGAPAGPSADEPIGQGAFPAPLQEYVGGDLDAVKWRSVGMGVKQAILKKDGSTSVRLLYIPKGMAMPDHSHGGLEMTLVLQGAYRDDDGEFHRGDIEVANDETQHTPVAFGPEDCICLTATDARLKFTSILPRLAQPFLQI
ncbi:ChrR family anti-sigma-E factor [Pseudoruegeria sp. SK021]|uniref:ChrR family anti-sigma-E factor n=1 Tax=Pseudoruegeria sp. SK021 TaxID=1933035 RepID=UPI000A21CA91|nr:ChrR family anti-sigma-E factor [Pseudoruegeria sp. SK021]OSP55026.1 transcriptional regulator [Pseudoruegeria sp. SK021]